MTFSRVALRLLLFATLTWPLAIPSSALAQTAEPMSNRVGDTHRAAILVGVATYRPDGYVASLDGSVVMLRNLQTPCRDVEEMSARLQRVNWHFDNSDPNAEIHTYCDAALDKVQGEITRRISELDHPGDLLVIYLGGHGAEIAGRSYFFGPSARLDMPATIERLKTYSKSLLFAGQALDLDSTIEAQAGLIYQGNILVIFGACRDDPVTYGAVAKAINLRVGRPYVGIKSLGVRVLYATMPGGVIADGVGLSFLARAFAGHIRQGATIYDVINDASLEVRTETANEMIETPVALGDFRDIYLCFSGCSQPLKAQERKTSAFSSLPREPAKLIQRVSLQQEAMPKEQSSDVELGFKIVRQGPAPETFKTLKSTPMGVDIYWCESGGIARHQSQANTMASNLALLGDSQGIAGPGTMLGSVRTKALPDIENARPGLRFARNAVRYDSGNLRSALLAKRIRNSIPEHFYIEPVLGSGLDTINVFLCDGGKNYAESSRLFVQASNETQRGVGLYLSGQIERDNPELWVADAIDIRPPVQKASPNHTLVKYFDTTDRPLADRVAKSVGKWLQSPPSTVYARPKGSDSSKNKGLIELWLGRDLDPTTVRTSVK